MVRTNWLNDYEVDPPSMDSVPKLIEERRRISDDSSITSVVMNKNAYCLLLASLESAARQIALLKGEDYVGR